MSDHKQQDRLQDQKAGSFTQSDETLSSYDNSKSSLRGWPGFRTRPGRSGLDPVDSYAEGAHIEGVFLRALITLKLRTRNPLFLFFFLFLSALLAGLPLFFIASLAITGTIGGALLALLLFAIAILPGLAFLANFVLSLVTKDWEEQEGMLVL